MSFSARVKEELSHQLSKARHCQIAELAVDLSFAARFISMKRIISVYGSTRKT